MIQRELLSVSGNPSKAFMFLELGIIPVKYVIMYKRRIFLYDILQENKTSTLRQVYNVLKSESRKGDFEYLVKKDLNKIQIEISEEEIKHYSKEQWRYFVKKNVTDLAFKMLKQ